MKKSAIMRPILLLAGTVFAVLPLLAVGCVCPPPQQGRGGHQDEGDRVLEAEAAPRRSADTIPAMVALSDAAPVDKVLHEHPHFAMIIRWAAYTDQLDPVKRYIASTASRARCFVLYERVDVMTGYGP